MKEVRKILQAILWLAIATTLVTSCTEKTTVVQSSSGVAISGEVFIWRCGVGDYINNSGSDLRFASSTQGDSAKISFVRLNGLSHSVFTDDSSSFRRVLDEGAYIIVVETAWTDPDTIYNVYLDGDTAIRIDLVFDYLHPTDLAVSFWYENGDSLGASAEWDYIRLLNGYIRMLDISGHKPPPEQLDLRHVSVSWGGSVAVYWRISIRRPPAHIGDVIRHARKILVRYPDRFPEDFGVNQYFAYICLD